jgi:DNA-binding MarR family transcriptional regulator
MPREGFLKTVRAMAEAWQAFEGYAGSHIRTLRLTPAQFDIIATLGNTPGMTCKELGEKTLITKGTLTGVLDRLEARKLIRRQSSPSDGRATFIRLTARGEKLFEKTFTAHVAHCKSAFSELSAKELDTLNRLLGKLRDAFRSHGTEAPR